MENIEYLDRIMNPASFRIYNSNEEWASEEEILKIIREFGTDAYKEITIELEKDMKNLGMSVTYSAKIIIREVAMNLLTLDKIKRAFIQKDIFTNETIIKPDLIETYKGECYSNKNSQKISYTSALGSEKVHPVFDKLLPKLQKQIHNGLKDLGLLPIQTIERQKLTIIKKLKQTCKKMDKEYSVEAIQKKNRILARTIM